MSIGLPVGNGVVTFPERERASANDPINSVSFPARNTGVTYETGTFTPDPNGYVGVQKGSRPFAINGTPIPTPDSYKAGIQDLSSKESGRNLSGFMQKDIIAVKDTYECQWTRLSWADAQLLLNLVDGKSSIMFTYADPRLANTFQTNEFYVGDRTATALNLNDPDSTWGSISMKFIRI